MLEDIFDKQAVIRKNLIPKYDSIKKKITNAISTS